MQDCSYEKMRTLFRATIDNTDPLVTCFTFQQRTYKIFNLFEYESYLTLLKEHCCCVSSSEKKIQFEIKQF